MNDEEPGRLPLPPASVSGSVSPSESKTKWSMRFDPDPELAHLDTASSLRMALGRRCPHRLGNRSGTATRTSPPRSSGGGVEMPDENLQGYQRHAGSGSLGAWRGGGLRILSPLRGWFPFAIQPTAHAVGYCLSALRAWARHLVPDRSRPGGEACPHAPRRESPGRRLRPGGPKVRSVARCPGSRGARPACRVRRPC